MIVREDLLKKLRSTFNLNIYEVKIWTALLSKGSATAGELSDMSNVPRSRSYDILESLEKKGFIIMKLGRPIKYLAVPPQEIIKRVKKSLQEKAEEEVKLLEDVQNTDVFQELSLLFKHGIESIDPSSIAGSFKGRKNVYNHIANLMSNAKKEVIIVTTADGIVRKAEYMKSTLRKLKNNKINIKIAASLKTEEAKKAAEELKQYADVIDLDLNARFVIVDNKEIVFMVGDKVHENADVGIWATTPFFANALKSMLDKVWGK
ncbi:MAG TPA: helix-turn-helix domain-containing protein [Candidatus Nanoarchaeia archaeon]|nr:helix-turn-helix domain-containing protein [Candidatus Nanoarchaeia archaeon]